ncbi:MAG: phosphomannomutase [Proteobacteria bacterium]|nr:phosphomannomutase [Pseudomonadota bacterium]
MALKFGTSGVRGLVTEMTDLECYLYAKAYIQYLKTRMAPEMISLAGDLRSSTPRIKKAVAFAIQEEGILVDNCGDIPTAAVTCYGMQNDRPSIMITGSHIPDDRNGIKFNMPWGEILKEDEVEISKRYSEFKETLTARSQALPFDEDGYFKSNVTIEMGEVNSSAERSYVNRFINFFPAHCLKGLKVVLYQHSAVGRDIFLKILEQLGAEVIPLGRSDSFIPVDTEAVENEEQLAAWVKEHNAHALATTDGDSDRPLIVDEKGKVVRGDVLGILVSDFLKADSVSTPVSCNTALEKCGKFRQVCRTRIGSPYVIEAMNKAVNNQYKTVVGYEANGGYLTATDIINPATGETLKALPTRDAALPVIAILRHSLEKGKTISQLVADLPPRYTASGLLREFPVNISKKLIENFTSKGQKNTDYFFRAAFGAVESFDFTDGVRITFSGGDILHLRPSGNAPEFRCYTESSTEVRARENNDKALQIVRDIIRPAIEKGCIS